MGGEGKADANLTNFLSTCCALTPAVKFRGQLIFFTKDDVTIRRPSGAILVIDNYEIAALSDGKACFEVQ